jgi:hypothetical protein
MELFNILGHTNANQNYMEILPSPVRMATIKKTKLNVGKDAGERESLNTVGRM